MSLVSLVECNVSLGSADAGSGGGIHGSYNIDFRHLKKSAGEKRRNIFVGLKCNMAPWQFISWSRCNIFSRKFLSESWFWVFKRKLECYKTFVKKKSVVSDLFDVV